MLKKIFFIAVLFSFVSDTYSQLDADVSFNAMSFCGENSVLEMQDNSTGGVVATWSWSITGPAGFVPVTGNTANQNATLTELGLYSVTLTVCDATMACNTQVYNSLISVLEKPEVSIDASNYCIGKENIFTASLTTALAIDEYFWDFGEGAGYQLGINPDTYTYNSVGANIVSLHILAANSCRDTATINVTVLDKPNAIITASDTFVCVGNSVNFSALNSTTTTAGLTYAWDTDYNTGIDNNNNSFTILANESKLIMLIVEDANTCVDTAFKGLDIVQSPDVSFTATAQCADVPFSLSATILQNGGSPIDSIYWYIDSATYLSGMNVNYSHPNKDSIPIILFATNDEGCIDGSQKYILIDSLPDAKISINDTIICAGVSLTLNALGDANFLWTNDSTTNDSIVVSPSENTVYKLIGLSNNGACPNSESEVLVEVLQEPDYLVDASSFKPGLGTPVFLDISYEPQFSSTDSIKWLPSGTTNELAFELGSENNFIARETVSFPIEVKYTKETTACVFNTTIAIEVNDNCDAENVFIPNVFTPNSDGKNEEFKIKGFSLELLERFIIYNRGGQEIFSAENVSFNNGVANTGWNGNNKNNIRCTTGVYVYYYKAKCINGLETEASGNITLFR